MAVVTVKSGVLTNRDASPQVFSNPALQASFLREQVGVLELASGDSIASLLKFFSIPSNARLSQLLLFCDDVGTTGAMDLGLYRTTKDGGAVVDADFFGSAIVLSGGALNGVDITHESTVYDIDDLEKMIWQALGLTEDPQTFYDVVGTLTTASDAAATVGLKGRWVW